ncbi:MAG: hypothetical protein JXB49_03120 [Bacteroidales bacterium]|nr:hypothetical protein [Bacteroidales bacterium]
MKQDGDNNGNINIEELLKAITAEEITNIFKEIDQKIISLHQCSSDDFLQLGAHFKTYYKESKQISDNASEIYELNAGKDNEITTNQLSDIYKNFNAINKYIKNEIGHQCQSFEDIIYKLNLINLPVNNFNQNLVTLKLVATNLELGATRYQGQKRQKTYDDSCDIRSLISNIKGIYPLFINALNDLYKFFQNTVNDFSFIQEKILSIIAEIHTILNEIIEKSEQKKVKAYEVLPRLKEKTDHTSKSIARIITNLQYHDIIRQKIDHIQATHKDILKDLNLLASDENKSKEDKAKFYSRIRDIAGLQAAQLIHANKEYQKAIDIITLMFLDIGDDMKAISNMCHEISGFDHIADTQQNASKSKCLDKVKSLVKNMESYEKKNMEINSNGLKLLEKVKDVFNKIMLLDTQLSTISQNAVKDIDNHQEIINELHQIQTLSADIKTEYENIKDIFESIVTLANQAFIRTSLANETENKDRINNIIELLQIITNNLISTKDKTEKLLTENTEKSEIITNDIRESIEKVKYYDVFERTAEEIINELNIVNIKLSGDMGKLNKSKVENLQYIKQRYTMASEHLIHEKITNKENAKKMKIDIDEDQENEDNIEFF